MQDQGNVDTKCNRLLEVQIDKKTGAVSRLYSKKASWNVFGAAQDANALEVMGEDGSAWTIRYTGSDNVLTTEGASVSVVDNGPVFARVRVNHAFGKSTYNQDIIVYGALDRVDVPTTVNWQEHGQLLKIRLPINASHVEANAQIPFGSIVRPVNGQECPGQKWMDASQAIPVAVKNAVPLDLSSLFNSSSVDNFNGNGANYPADSLPNAGLHRLGSFEVPFTLAGYHPNQSDNVVAAGQQISFPANATANTLYLLAARSKDTEATAIGFQLADGRTEFRAFDLNNWKANTYPDNEIGFGLPGLHERKARGSNAPGMWITQVPIPDGAKELVLPNDPGFHIFAATIGANPQAPTMYGLSVLNDSKYGFDVSNNVFRLTALRSSGRPDPDPDSGVQQFTYSLYPHAGDWRTAHTDERALDLNIPLLATVTTPHAPTQQIPSVTVENVGGKGDLIVTALKRSEDSNGYILRFYEADGQDTQARVDFDQPMHVESQVILRNALCTGANCR